ncbi:MAG: flagellar hook-length control protein FliK [Spirochaetia bacterium]|nr:flagellar hook-length control protein FliK [Spirochaetia bacterium]
MQNLSEIVNTVQSKYEPHNGLFKQGLSEANRPSGTLLPFSFENHLNDAVRPVSENPVLRTRSEVNEKENPSEQRDSRDSMEKRSEEEMRTSEEKKPDDVRDSREQDSRSDNKNEKDDLSKSDRNKDLQGAAAKDGDTKKAEKKDGENAGQELGQKAVLKKDVVPEGLLNELFKKAFGDKEHLNELKEKKKNIQKDAAEDKISQNQKNESVLRSSDGVQKNPETIHVPLDPEKWKVAGQVDSREASLQAVQKKKSEKLNIQENSQKSSEDKGEGNQNHSSSRSNDVKNIFSELKDVQSSQMTKKAAEAESVSANKKLFNELVEKARLNLGPDGNSTASIRLNPESLGKMTMNLRLIENSLEAKILVGSEAAKKMIMDEIEHLKFELRSQGIQVDSFTVKVKESLSSEMDHDTEKGNLPNSQNQYSENFSDTDRTEEEKYDIFTHQIAENIDDSEYGTILYHQNLHEGAVNLSA